MSLASNASVWIRSIDTLFCLPARICGFQEEMPRVSSDNGGKACLVALVSSILTSLTGDNAVISLRGLLGELRLRGAGLRPCLSEKNLGGETSAEEGLLLTPLRPRQLGVSGGGGNLRFWSTKVRSPNENGDEFGELLKWPLEWAGLNRSGVWVEKVEDAPGEMANDWWENEGDGLKWCCSGCW